MFSSTTPNFPLYSQRAFMDYLRGGGTIAALLRYLARVEYALRPRMLGQETAGSELRDVATLVLFELTQGGTDELERRVHRAVQDLQAARADLDRSVDEIGERMATAVRCINIAAAMLVDTNGDAAIGRWLQMPRGVIPRWTERRGLLNRVGHLKGEIELMLDQTDLDRRRDEIERLYNCKREEVFAIVEALKTVIGKLPSQFERNDQPRKYGVVRSGCYAEFLAALREADAVWNEGGLLALQESVETACDRLEDADARSKDMSGLTGDLLNWLDTRSNFHLGAPRPKADDRNAALAPVSHTA